VSIFGTKGVSVMKKMFVCFSSLVVACAACAADEKAPVPAKVQIVLKEVAKPSRNRTVISPVELQKTEVVTKTSSVPATLVTEEHRGILGRWKARRSVVVETTGK
jgi:hypothetical protein